VGLPQHVVSAHRAEPFDLGVLLRILTAFLRLRYIPERICTLVADVLVSQVCTTLLALRSCHLRLFGLNAVCWTRHMLLGRRLMRTHLGCSTETCPVCKRACALICACFHVYARERMSVVLLLGAGAGRP
jgi:hypothetical protein